MKYTIPPITIQQMVVFVMVVEENGFANASKQLLMTQSAVSKAVAKLEKELAIKLFNRSTRHLELTEAGKILYEDMKLNLQSLQNSYHHALQTEEAKNSLLKIGLMNTARPARYFTPVMDRFTKAFPDVRCEVESQYMTDLPVALENHNFDIVILPDFTRFYIEKRGLKWAYMAVDNAQLLMSVKHPLAKRKKLSTKELLDLKFVAVASLTEDEEYLRDLTMRFAPYKKFPDVVYTYKTAHDIRYLFRSDDAVLLVDAYFDYPLDSGDFVVRPVTDQKNGAICAWDPRVKSKVVEQFLSVLPQISTDPLTGFPISE